MCDDEYNMLQKIIANPGDDIPRLVYADWIEERGQEDRARYIRLSIAAAKAEAKYVLPKDPMEKLGALTAIHQNERAFDTIVYGLACGPCGCPMCLEAEAEKLEYALDDEVTKLAPSSYANGVLTTAYVTDRGFIDKVDTSHYIWERKGPITVARHPITEVRLGDISWYGRMTLAPAGEPQYRQVRLINMLPTYLREYYTDEVFPTEVEANEYLSQSAIKWAKKQAEISRNRS